MKLLLISVLTVASSPFVWAQSTASSEIDQLRTQVALQAKQLELQQKHIEALEAAQREQQEAISRVLDSKSASEETVALVNTVNKGESLENPQQPVVPSEPKHPSNESVPQVVENPPPEFDPDQEIDAEPEATGPALKLGPAKVQLLGYVALTGLWRSTNGGGNVGTGFATIPYSNIAPGNISEFRWSAQSTRLAIRADADLAASKVAGYFEFDFGGTVPGNIAVSSSSYGFRIRQGWFDYRKGKFEITGGQTFSLLTPVKKDMVPWPGDTWSPAVVDTNYVAGYVWTRAPGLRLVYHASTGAAFGFSLENPEQQVGNTVVFPTALASTLNGQYDIGTNELKVPNAAPDFIFKASFDGKPGGHSAHLDTGGILRVFRSSNVSNPITNHSTAVGYGGNINATYEIVKGFRLVVNGYASKGGGRYIGGLFPDVIVNANGTIQPINAYSGIGGLEITARKTTNFYAYYSVGYAQRQTALDLNGSYIGWGYPGATNAADRTMNQISVGWNEVFWKHEGLGSVQLGTQYSYLELTPWTQGTGPRNASTNMLFTQLRYNLP